MNFHYLKELESEAIYIFRETAAQFERPVLLFSGGKDSTVLAHLAKKAFFPARIPFPFLHVDTGHNFDETIEFRDKLMEDLNTELVVGSVEESIRQGRVREETDISASRNKLQTVTLLDAIKKHGFDAAFGGGRRDEEKARAKERFFSHRDEEGKWDPHNQRPELWNLFNGAKRQGEHFRVFPLSNWTELDIWNYIDLENIDVPSLYFSHERECFVRDGIIFACSGFCPLSEDEKPETMRVRFRTIGDITCTGAIRSEASSVKEIIAEIASARTSERGTRSDDRRSETAMEDRKRSGYF